MADKRTITENGEPYDVGDVDEFADGSELDSVEADEALGAEHYEEAQVSE